jgi:hypothetical protein
MSEGNEQGSQQPHLTGTIFIEIDELYALGSDSYSWPILKRRGYKDSHKWKAILWYATFEQCVHGLWQRAVQTCGAQSLAELLAESQRVLAVICRATRPRFKVEAGS